MARTAAPIIFPKSSSRPRI